MRSLFDTGSSARFSPCGRYRYELRRPVGCGPAVVFIMLNPSTADASVDDPTIRRCIRFAQEWGCGELVVVNLFALRATDPKELRRADDPIGPANDDAIHNAITTARLVVAAWGTHGTLNDRDERVHELISQLDRTPVCLGRTQAGHPRHPLYVRADCQPTPFHWCGVAP